MKKLIPICAVSLLGLWIGCGDDDEPNGPDGPPELVRVYANTTVDAPTLDNADEAVWASVDSFRVNVDMGNVPKLGPPQAADYPPNIYVQAINKAGNLYLRLQWTDTSFDAYPDHFWVEQINTIQVPPVIRFAQKSHYLTNEDQIFVMFDGLPDGGYDVWKWSVLTTGGCGLGKGYSYKEIIIDAIVDTILIADALGQPGDSATVENPPATVGDPPAELDWPTYGPKDTSDFDGYVLYFDSVVHWLNDTLDTIVDTFPDPDDTLPVFFYNTSGWKLGQKVPGWLINSGFASLDDNIRGSRWDIKAVSVHDDDVGQYRVVLCRKLYTTFSAEEDIDLSAMDSVKVKIGVYDNQDDFNEAGNKRAFSDEFWIILK